MFQEVQNTRSCEKKSSDKLQSVTITSALLLSAENISSLEGCSSNFCLTVSLVLS